ncbi:hypothetical protein [Streptomyces alfalfae]|nr:hypothetical protein [Streptomyces alfalfae]
MILVVAYVLLVITTTGIPLAHWLYLPPLRPRRARLSPHRKDT